MTSESELTEGEDAYEFENLFDEDQELGQLVNGEICMKVYPFGNKWRFISLMIMC